MLYISNSHGKGRGVYTDSRIERETIIERTPILEIPQEEVEVLQLTMLNNYYFAWGFDQQQAALALGLGSIYNHSYTPNAVYIPREDEQLIEFVAIRKILATKKSL
ncbi:SET domain-containing protein-lysine N-methyltransferase [Endozoicomonas ascidiicola]|uniref:SET domain-containing protein-lysine N-methyltransferase n=1 Tax=Endozoicomonas ascidiicola TaxID=1698521 RepID=UPI000AA03D32|nr:SET domain-containing protein-lysine N-methyltransferase [Endozoicomonas ascidiicola]